MKPAKNQAYKIIISAFAGLGLVLIAGSAALGLAGRMKIAKAPPGPEQSMEALAHAIDSRDSAAAMEYIDFDALLEDINRTDIALVMHLEPTDPKVDTVLKTAMPDSAKRTMRSGFVNSLTDPKLGDSEPGSLLATLVSLKTGRIVRTSDGTAYVELPQGRRLMLAVAEGGIWRVVGYRGYENDFDKYQKATQKSVVDTLAPSNKDAGTPADGTKEKTAP